MEIKPYIIKPLIFILLLSSTIVNAEVRGIYITQPTLENTSTLKYLIKRSKAVGINTFVIDLKRISRKYNQNIPLVKQANLRYVARIVIFPHGGNRAKVLSIPYRQQKYKLVKQAIALGANAIQLDYIRYHDKSRAVWQNVKDIYQVIKWFHDRLVPQHIPLQIDIFGVVTKRDLLSIGQSARAFANVVEAMCPMVYPSHYIPEHYHSRRPYQTVFSSLQALKAQFGGHPPFKIYAFIEVSNYIYRYSGQQKLRYINEQLRGVRDSRISGWYAWSPRNRYNALFQVLR
ncbi:MAG: putative glycoside hydrolase [Gammaproteobacteria bacterium]